MNQRSVQLAACQEGSVCQQLGALGVLVCACTDSGELIDTPMKGDYWLTDLTLHAPIFRDALRRAARQWASESSCDRGAGSLGGPGCAEGHPVTEALPGVWLMPIELLTRRRISGYVVGVLFTHRILDSEQLCAMCQSAAADGALTRRMLMQLPLVPETEVQRIGSLVRIVQERESQLVGERTAIESVGRQLAESYEEMNLLYTIIQSMTVVERPERFIAIACAELLATLPYAWIGMVFADDRVRLKKLANRSMFVGRLPAKLSESRLRKFADNILLQAKPNLPIVIDDANTARYATPESRLMEGCGTTLIQPISSDGRVLGLLIAGGKSGEDTAASSVDMKLLGATASHTSIFVENAALYDDLNAMFLGTLEALTASIDAKDRYTCGHSQRVASLTQQLAQAVGLDEYTVARTRIAGLVHDVGKIGVPEHVLLKPGRLTNDEFALIRQHPEIGYRILKDIPQLEDILPGVLYHHERWDGNGYPSGRAGEDIPLLARLITLADSFDAMSSSRTYRTRLSREDVLAEITRCAGTQFDPQLAPIFVSLDFSEFDRLVAEHRALDPAEAPGKLFHSGEKGSEEPAGTVAPSGREEAA